MRNYKQLGQAQRYQIEIVKKAGKNQKEIAALLGVPESTISSELARNVSRVEEPRKISEKIWRRITLCPAQQKKGLLRPFVLSKTDAL